MYIRVNVQKCKYIFVHRIVNAHKSVPRKCKLYLEFY